jgi:hypothetical protein
MSFLAAVVLAAAGCGTSKQAVMSEADMVTAAQIDTMLAERLYTVYFQRAYPMGGPSFMLTHPYFISVIDDRVESFLPYFGRAYTIPYGGGEGLRFAAPISDYTDEVKRNGRRVISFDAATREDRYRFSLTVFPVGSCNLTVTAGQKQSISFSGEIDMDPEFEAVRIVE